MSKSTRVTSKGQVTIPQELRIEYGFHPDTMVRFEVVDGRVTLSHDVSPEQSRGERVVARLRGRADSGLSTEQIMAMTRT